MTASVAHKQNVNCHTAYTGRTRGVLRCGAALVAALMLVGCAVATVPELKIGLRNPTVPLGGTSRFKDTRFEGNWVTMACIGSCAPTERYFPDADGTFVRQVAETSTPYIISAPGVLRQIGGDDTLVVMWVDEGFRTAAVGDADGRWAAILNRTRKPAPDRIKAATEILDFNGWDVSQLRKMNG